MQSAKQQAEWDACCSDRYSWNSAYNFDGYILLYGVRLTLSALLHVKHSSCMLTYNYYFFASCARSRERYIIDCFWDAWCIRVMKLTMRLNSQSINANHSRLSYWFKPVSTSYQSLVSRLELGPLQRITSDTIFGLGFAQCQSVKTVSIHRYCDSLLHEFGNWNFFNSLQRPVGETFSKISHIPVTPIFLSLEE